MLANALHRSLISLLHVERRFDPFFRPFLDALAQEPIAGLVQAAINAQRPNDNLALVQELALPDENAIVQQIIERMSAYMREQYHPGTFQRAGNTKTHGVLRAEFQVHGDIPPNLRHGIFSAPRSYPAWVRLAGPGPDSPPDIEDVGVLSIGIKVMQVPGPKLLDDERFTQDFTGISTPTFTTPNIIENAKLQAAVLRRTPLFYFINPFDSHLLDGIMQGLWARTQSSPLQTGYWSCVPYLLGEGQAVQYAFKPRSREISAIPGLPGRPNDNYLREAMIQTLAERAVDFDVFVQVQTDPHRMPIENASVRWPEHLSTPIRVATLHFPEQRFASPAQLAFAGQLSINPWHCLAEHRPLGNQNRARLAIYKTLSALRQSMNGTPHVEPTGDEVFE
ncbi:Catalase family protein [Paraburkholderia sacchari]